MIVNTTIPFSYRITILALTLAGWLAMYFFVNRLEVDDQHRLDFGTAWDRKIPYRPIFALVYFSTYIFVILPFFFLSDAQLFYTLLISIIAISIASSLIHAIVPSKIERVEEITFGGTSGWMLGLFQKTCKPYGNFPSMHVGLSIPVIAANFMALGPAAGFITLVWGILIALSTLFTKQHYIADVLAGIIGGSLIFTLVFWVAQV